MGIYSLSFTIKQQRDQKLSKVNKLPIKRKKWKNNTYAKECLSIVIDIIVIEHIHKTN